VTATSAWTGFRLEDLTRSARPTIASARNRQATLSPNKSDAAEATKRWRDRPFSEKMELIAAIEDIRAWRFGSDRPSWLRPAAQAAAELGEWLDRQPKAQQSLRLE
jgi:hypothetical protein